MVKTNKKILNNKKKFSFKWTKFRCLIPKFVVEQNGMMLIGLEFNSV